VAKVPKNDRTSTRRGPGAGVVVVVRRAVVVVRRALVVRRVVVVVVVVVVVRLRRVVVVVVVRRLVVVVRLASARAAAARMTKVQRRTTEGFMASERRRVCGESQAGKEHMHARHSPRDRTGRGRIVCARVGFEFRAEQGTRTHSHAAQACQACLRARVRTTQTFSVRGALVSLRASSGL
jgi:hypothetical protein